MLGGTPRRLWENGQDGSFSPEGSRIAFISTERDPGIWVMGTGGEDARRIVAQSAEEHFHLPRWSPDGRRIAYVKHRPSGGPRATIESRPLEGGEATVILSDPNVGWVHWLPDGRILFERFEPPPNEKESNLWAVSVDPRKGTASGEPRRLTLWAGFAFGGFSVTADGKRLVFLKRRNQADVYVAELEGGGTRLKTPRRLTLDDRGDWPSAWTRDGETVLFSSDRNGSIDIFKQGLGQTTAEALVLGPEEQTEPRLSPDGSWMLYWSYPKTPELRPRMRLMRAPVSGGPHQPVLEATYPSGFRCAAVPPGPCILVEDAGEGKRIVFSALDPVEGRKGEVVKIEIGDRHPSWDLSRDGSRVAIADPKGGLRILTLSGGAVRSVPLGGWTGLDAVAWSSDGVGLFVTARSPRETALLHVRLDGAARVLRKAPTDLGRIVPSPNGRFLAFTQLTREGNAWMIEGF